jgi:hypothetical protein
MRCPPPTFADAPTGHALVGDHRLVRTVVGGFEGIPACRMATGPEGVVVVGVQTAAPSGSGAA